MKPVTRTPINLYSQATTEVTSVLSMVSIRDHIEERIHEKLGPVLEVIQHTRQLVGVRITEVHREHYQIVVYLKLLNADRRPDNAVLTLPGATLDRFDPRSIRALVFDHLTIIPDDHE